MRATDRSQICMGGHILPIPSLHFQAVHIYKYIYQLWVGNKKEIYRHCITNYVSFSLLSSKKGIHMSGNWSVLMKGLEENLFSSTM